MLYDYLVIILYPEEHESLAEGLKIIDENAISELVKRKVISDTFRRLNSDKKEKLYRTALWLFGKYGYDGLSVDQYCLQSKISKGSFFQYFPSKTHLLEFTLLLFDEWLKTEVEQISKVETTVLAKDRLQYLLMRVTSKSGFDEFEKKFYLFAVNALHHSAVTAEGINIGRHFDVYVHDIIKRGAQTGEIRTDIPLATTIVTVARSFNALLTHCFLYDRQLDEVTVRSFTSILFDGINS